MTDTLAGGTRWRPVHPSGSRYVRFARLMGCTDSRARHRLPEIRRKSPYVARAMVQAGESAELCTWIAELEAELEADVPDFREAVTAETTADATEEQAQTAYHLDSSDQNARALLQHWGRVLRTTTQAMAAIRHRHPDA